MSRIKEVLSDSLKKRTRTDKIRQILNGIEERKKYNRTWTIFSPSEISDFSYKDKRIISKLLKKYGLRVDMSVGYIRLDW